MLIYVLFPVFLFLPGWLIARVCLNTPAGYLPAFALSLAFLTLNLYAFYWSGASMGWFTGVVLGELVILMALGFAGRARLRDFGRATGDRPFLMGAAAVAVMVVAYLYVAGTYTEVPADVWRHLGYTQQAMRAASSGGVSVFPSVWYHIPGWFIDLAGVDMYGFIRHFGNANTMVYCLGLYVFSHHIACKLDAGKTGAACIAVAAVLLSAFSIGVDLFSYVRYYTFGPTFHNILVYLCCIPLVVEIFERDRVPPRAAALVAVMAITMVGVHEQEAAFLFALGFSMSLVVIARSVYRRTVGRRADGPAGTRGPAPWLALALVIGVFGFFLYSRYGLPVRGRLDPWVVPVSSVFGIGDHIYIADPWGQVFAALSVWGLLVYLLFALHWRIFKDNLYIVSGMLIPAVTVFNPMFVDLFVRHNETAPIYRFIYIVPLGLVAAVVLVHNLRRLGAAAPPAKVYRLASVSLLLLLLLPNEGTWLHNRHSRLPTLVPVHPQNDYPQWRDMLDFLDRHGPAAVISDPVTSYVIRGLLNRPQWGYKFHWSRPHLNTLAGAYRQYTGALLVINRRDGGPSDTGRRSNHWPEDVLKVSRYYPRELLEAIRARPAHFRKIWNNDRIHIYRITA